MTISLQHRVSAGKLRKVGQFVAAAGVAVMLLGCTQPGMKPQAQPGNVITATVTVSHVVTVASPEALPTRKAHQGNAAAQAAFAEGMVALKRFEAGDTRGRDLAEEKFSKAIELDPTYAEAFFYRGYLASTYENPTDVNAPLVDAEKAIELDPDYAEAYFLRAQIFWKRDLEDRWLEGLNRAIALKPDYLAPLYLRAKFYVIKDEWDKALPDLNKLVELIPEHDIALPAEAINYRPTSPYYRLTVADVVKIYADRATAFTRQQNWAAAILDYTKAIEGGPGISDLYFGRGEAYLALGQVKELEADFTKAITLNPGYLVKLQADLPRLKALLAPLEPGTDELATSLKNLIGRVEHNSDEVSSANSEAMAEYEAGLRYLHEFEGVRRIDMGLLDEMTNAKLAFASAIDKDPAFAAAYLQRARLQTDSGPIIHDLNQAIELNPAYAEAYVARAQWFLLDKKVGTGIMPGLITTPEEETQGLADLNKALELKPNYYYALLVRARIAREAGKLDEALADLNQAVASLPPDISQLEVYRTYFWRGQVFLAKGMYHETIADFNQALDAAGQFNPLIAADMKDEFYVPLRRVLDKLEPGELRTEFEALVAKFGQGVVIDWGPSK